MAMLGHLLRSGLFAEEGLDGRVGLFWCGDGAGETAQVVTAGVLKLGEECGKSEFDTWE
jgi:hypothetical protein